MYLHQPRRHLWQMHTANYIFYTGNDCVLKKSEAFRRETPAPTAPLNPSLIGVTECVLL